MKEGIRGKNKTFCKRDTIEDDEGKDIENKKKRQRERKKDIVEEEGEKIERTRFRDIGKE